MAAAVDRGACLWGCGHECTASAAVVAGVEGMQPQQWLGQTCTTGAAGSGGCPPLLRLGGGQGRATAKAVKPAGAQPGEVEQQLWENSSVEEFPLWKNSLNSH